MKFSTPYDRPEHKGKEPYAGYVVDPLRPTDKDGKPNYKKDKEGRLIPLDPGLTKQEMTPDTDINRIMSKYEPGLATKLLSLPADGADYADMASVKDFQESLHIVQEAEEAFAALPAKIRARFENSPVKMLQFVHNPANREEMYELGLAVRPDPAAAGNAVPAQNSAAQNAPTAGTPASGGKP